MARRITEIKNLPISELSDEEIVKAAMYRLEAKAVMLIYQDRQGQTLFLGRYKKGGSAFCSSCIKAYENFFGIKMRRIKNE